MGMGRLKARWAAAVALTVSGLVGGTIHGMSSTAPQVPCLGTLPSETASHYVICSSDGHTGHGSSTGAPYRTTGGGPTK